METLNVTLTASLVGDPTANGFEIQINVTGTRTFVQKLQLGDAAERIGFQTRDGLNVTVQLGLNLGLVLAWIGRSWPLRGMGFI